MVLCRASCIIARLFNFNYISTHRWREPESKNEYSTSIRGIILSFPPHKWLSYTYHSSISGRSKSLEREFRGAQAFLVLEMLVKLKGMTLQRACMCPGPAKLFADDEF